MPAPTTQQLKQMQQNSPEWQARQQENMYRQKWQGIFNNRSIDISTAKIPQDATELNAAKTVAQEMLNSKDTPGDRKAVCRSFLRRCTIEIQRNKNATGKQILQNWKQNPGIGTYSAAELTPKSDNIKDIMAAGINAGKEAAFHYLTNNQAGTDSLVQQTKQYMQNKCYNVCFWYTFYNSVDMSRDMNADKEKTQRLNYLTPLYEQYEQQANPGNIKDTINGKGPTPLDKVRRNMANGGSTNGN